MAPLVSLTGHATQYNETINDLLGKGEFDKKKHEIKHEKLHGSIPSTRCRGCGPCECASM